MVGGKSVCLRATSAASVGKLPRSGCPAQATWNSRGTIEWPKAYVFRPSHESLFHRSEFFFRARSGGKLKAPGNSWVTIPLAKRLFFQAFRSGIVTASGDTFTVKNIFGLGEFFHDAMVTPSPHARGCQSVAPRVDIWQHPLPRTIDWALHVSGSPTSYVCAIAVSLRIQNLWGIS